jgi:uncharacterized protein (TIGR02246 family)
MQRMKSVVILVVCATAVAAAAGQNKPAPPAADETAVRDVVKRYVDARERRDASAIRALFTEDADQLTSSGEWRRGREDVVKGTLASSAGNAGTRTITVDSVRFPAAGVALADGAYTIAGAGTTRNMRTSFVMIRSGDGWRISAIRNMLPAQ